MAILISVFFAGYHGKTIDFQKYSPCHRTTVARFLNKGKWDDTRPEDILKTSVVQFIYGEALRSGKPVFCIVDVGVKLFERTHRGLHLMKAGISLYQDAKYIIGYCRDSVIRAKNAMQEDEVVLRIGTSPMTPARILVE